MNQQERKSVVDLYKALTGIDRDEDINDELSHAQRDLRVLKSAISEISKQNYMLEQDVRYLDQRIALLIQNKMNAEEERDIASRLEQIGAGDGGDLVLDAEQMRLYGALMFLLQSEPQHIASLTSRVTMAEIDELLQTVMFSIYGNQFDSREEHLLLVMFGQVLATQFEATTEFSSLLRANTPVSRMMMCYTRRGLGQAYLQSVLGPEIVALISRTENIDISPLPVFNKLKAANPDDEAYNQPFVLQTAAEHPRFEQVQAVVKPRFQALQTLIDDFLTTLLASAQEVPYGIRWMAKQVRLLARRKFPDASDQQVTSLIGGYFFLRFVNPAIVSPHTFLLVDSLPSEQAGRNLTIIAKIVQMAANQSSGQKTMFTVDVNDLVRKYERPVQQFLNELCEVPDFYDAQELDQYLALTAPERKLKIYHTELVDIHRLLAKYPSSNPRLTSLLHDLGPVPPAPPRAAKTQIELPLASRWEALSDDTAARSSQTMRATVTFLEAKTLLVNIRRTFPALPETLSLESVAEFAANSPDRAFADRGMRARLMLSSMHETIGETELELLHKEVNSEVSRLGSMTHEVNRERKSLEGVYTSVKEHHDYLHSQIETFRSYLENVRHHAGERAVRETTSRAATFEPQDLYNRGVLKSWPFSNTLSQLIYFRLVVSEQGQMFQLAMRHRERSDPLLVVYFALDDLLELKEQRQDVDLRCYQLAINPLLELVGRWV